jgi:hypothetical protein
LVSINDFLLFWDEEAQQQIQSARSLVSGRLSTLSTDSDLPPKSPRFKSNHCQQNVGNAQLLNALVAKSKLIILVGFYCNS